MLTTQNRCYNIAAMSSLYANKSDITLCGLLGTSFHIYTCIKGILCMTIINKMVLSNYKYKTVYYDLKRKFC